MQKPAVRPAGRLLCSYPSCKRLWLVVVNPDGINSLLQEIDVTATVIRQMTAAQRPSGSGTNLIIWTRIAVQ
jgi:hypothetical protein